MALNKKEFFTAHLLSGMMNQDHIDMIKKVDLAVRYAEYLDKKFKDIAESVDKPGVKEDPKPVK